MDKAVLEFKKVAIKSYKKVEEIPFDFVRKMMSVAVVGPQGRTLITKGAPEEVLKRCSTYLHNKTSQPIKTADKAKILKYYEAVSQEGYRVLAVAIKRKIVTKKEYSIKDEKDLELLGFVAFLDPPRQDIKDVLARLSGLGVDIKIITGDNELVAQKICQEVGLPIKGIVLGSQINRLNDESFGLKAEKCTVFARFSPDQKNRVMTVLRARKHVVGYLGDGINDALSLKTSDVGISVKNAVDVAQESADMVLTKKSLKSLVDGIVEGRKVFANTMKYIMMGLSSNFGNMFSVAGAIFFIPFLPMLPVQILLNNFLYDFSQIAIPTDNVDSDWIKSPRRWNLQFVKRFMYVFGPISSLFDFLTFFILYYIFAASPTVFQTGWFMESLATQVLVIYVIRTKHFPLVKSRPSGPLFWGTVGAVVAGWLIPYTPVGEFFKFTPLPPKILLSIGLLVIAYLLIVELSKRLFYRKYGFGE